MVSVIDTASNSVTASISVGIFSYGIVITPDGTRAYFTNPSRDGVAAIDTATNTLIGDFIPVGRCPIGIAIMPLVPRSRDDCKNGGYAKFGPPAGPFKNQGQCIKYVNERSRN